MADIELIVKGIDEASGTLNKIADSLDGLGDSGGRAAQHMERLGARADEQRQYIVGLAQAQQQLAEAQERASAGLGASVNQLLGFARAATAVGSALVAGRVTRWVVDMVEMGAVTAEARDDLEWLKQELQATKQEFATTVSDGVMPYIHNLRKATEAQGGLRQEILRGDAALTDYIGTVDNYQRKLEQLEATQRAMEMEERLEASERIREAYRDEGNALSNLSVYQGESRTWAEQQTEAMRLQEEAARALAAELDHIAMVQTTAMGSVQALTVGWNSQRSIAQALIGDLGALDLGSQQFANAQLQVLSAMGQLTPAQVGQIAVMDRALQAYENGEISLGNLIELYGMLGTTAGPEEFNTKLDEAITRTQLYDEQAMTTYATSVPMNIATTQASQEGLTTATQMTADTVPNITTAIKTMVQQSTPKLAELKASVDAGTTSFKLMHGAIETVKASLRGLSNVNIRGHISVTMAESRQHGGPVYAGMPYVVGDPGPELFVPRVSGHIIPRHQTRALMSGGGGGGGGYSGATPISISIPLMVDGVELGRGVFKGTLDELVAGGHVTGVLSG